MGQPVRLLSYRFTQRITFPDLEDNLKAPPASVDWEALGALGPVRDQTEHCGSCYAIAPAVVLESRFKIHAGIPKVVPFSVQQIVDCSQPYGNKGCIGGSRRQSYKYVMGNGIVKQASYPYEAKVGSCKTSITTDAKQQCLK
ncbi:Chymomexicain, putative, partial [Perkinsus marinus ATCC 50983]